jgi:hypothetical protein
MKIRPVGAELFHTDRRTDMTELIVVFRYFANAPKIVDTNSHTELSFQLTIAVSEQ